MRLKLLFLSIIMCGSIVGAQAQKRAQKQADADTDNFRYEIEAVDVAVQGTCLVKVWTYSKKPIVAISQAQKNALHGIIFKGFTGIAGVPGRKALVANPAIEQEKAAFFEQFFSDEGPYKRYVSVVANGAVDPDSLIKVGKEYKVGIVVAVNIDQLRKALETEGVVKALNSGF